MDDDEANDNKLIQYQNKRQYLRKTIRQMTRALKDQMRIKKEGKQEVNDHDQIKKKKKKG